MSEELPLTEQDQILADVTAARRILSSKDVEPSRLTIGNDEGVRSLPHVAAFQGNDTLLKCLIDEFGVDPELADKENRRLLFAAAQLGQVKTMKMLIEEYNCDPEARGVMGETTLHAATYSSNLDAVKYLVEEQKVEINPKDDTGRTPLDKASSKAVADYLSLYAPSKGHEGIGNASSKRAAEHTVAVENHEESDESSSGVSTQDEEKFTVYDQALLMEANNVDKVRHILNTKMVYKRVDKPHKIDVNTVQIGGSILTSVHVTAKLGTADVMKCIINEFQARRFLGVSSMKQIGRTPMHIAAEQGNLETLKVLLDDDRTDPDVKTNTGETVLHAAVKTRCFDIVKYLVEEQNVGIAIENQFGETAFDVSGGREALRGGNEVTHYLHEKSHGVECNCANSNEVETNNASHSGGSSEELDMHDRTKLMQANDLDGVRHILKAKRTYNSNGELESINVNELRIDGWVFPLVHLTAKLGTANVMKCIIDEFEGNPILPDQLGRTPMHIAAEQGNFETLKVLLDDDRADPEVTTNIGETVLHAAAERCNLDVVKYLVEKQNMEITAENQFGETPFDKIGGYASLRVGHLRRKLAAKYLYKKMKEIGAIDDDDSHSTESEHENTNKDENHDREARGSNLLTSGGHAASEASAGADGDDTKEVDSISEQDSAEQEGDHGSGPEAFGSVNNNLDGTKEVDSIKERESTEGDRDITFEQFTEDDKATLEIACAKGNLDDAKKCLEKKTMSGENSKNELVDVNRILYTEGNSPLHVAASYGSVQVTKYLLEQFNANPDHPNDVGNTPLHNACIYGQDDVVDALGNHAATIDIQGYHGNSPLHLAARRGHVTVVDKLISQFDANVNMKNEEGKTPLHRAVERGQLTAVQHLGNHSAIADATDNEGETPLHLATKYGHMEIVVNLVEIHGADVSARNGRMETALHIAATDGHLELVKLLVEKYKVDIESKTGKMETPLHRAASHGHYDIVRHLIEKYGADDESKTIDGETARSLAEKGDQAGVAKFLIEKEIDSSPIILNKVVGFFMFKRKKVRKFEFHEMAIEYKDEDGELKGSIPVGTIMGVSPRDDDGYFHLRTGEFHGGGFLLHSDSEDDYERFRDIVYHLSRNAGNPIGVQENDVAEVVENAYQPEEE